MTARHKCAWPSCDVLIPPSWFFCATKPCQSARLTARLTGEATDDERVLLGWKERRMQLQTKEWNERGRARLAGIRAEFRKKREAHLLASAAWKDEQWERARANATEELMALIDEQQRDRDRVRRSPRDPWLLRSLDAPFGDDGTTLGDLISYRDSRTPVAWDDPTADTALAVLEPEDT